MTSFAPADVAPIHARPWGIVDLEARKLTRKVKVEKSPDGVWFGPTPAR